MKKPEEYLAILRVAIREYHGKEREAYLALQKELVMSDLDPKEYTFFSEEVEKIKIG